MRRISSSAGVSAGSSSARPSCATRRWTISTSSSSVVGHRQDDGVEAALQRARQLVDALVAIVGGGDDVEALARLHLGVQLGDRQRLLRKDGDQRVLHLGGDARQLLDARELALAHRAHHRAGAPAPRAMAPRPAAARSSSRSESRSRRCRRCPAPAASSRRRWPRPDARKPSSWRCPARRRAAARGRWPAWRRRSRSAGALPMYLGETVEAIRRACRPGGRCAPPRARASSWAGAGGHPPRASSASSSANCCSACCRRTDSTAAGVLVVTGVTPSRYVVVN